MSSSHPFTLRRLRRDKRWLTLSLIAMLISSVGGPGSVPLRAQSNPAAVGFVLDANDLRFIFRQIEIAQAHVANPAAGLLGPGVNQVNERRLPFGLRTVDGSFNHLTEGDTLFGASDQDFKRLTTPVFREAENGTSYTQKSGIVQDSQPRIISNLIVDQTANNPAALLVASAANPDVVADPLGTLPINNVAPDVGLSAPFNSMFTFFGQFFDHGLDLVNKGGNGFVMVPLQEDDPLFVPGSPTNFMVLTRATMRPGPDGIQGTADDIQEHNNQTTPFVDQNQTYTSHPSHQVFLREYAPTLAGPVGTGRLMDGGGVVNGVPVNNIGNWAEVKAQARNVLGIDLVDTDVFNVPLVMADPYGRYVRGAGGFPIMMTTAGPVVGNPSAPVSTANALRTGHGFLDDIAHNAVPTSQTGALLAPDDDLEANDIFIPRPAGTYDDELLDAHFVTGDGRGNENIALTAVHTVFHAEHNRLRDEIHTLINTAGFLTEAEVTAWLTTDAASGWDYGERLFQAARFVTEMQYQHLVFEEFGRTLAPSINEFIGDGINFQVGNNPAIAAEFAHQAYRLGHSMLTETIARTGQDGVSYDIPLLEGFLNPLEFNQDAADQRVLTAAEAAGAIFQGGTRQVGNDIDEFVTEAVRSRLLGLPLDLAVLNISRGRDTGIPPFNEVRRQLYVATGDPALVPYMDWADFGFALKHGESLGNFIAAYGTHPTITAATTVADKRAAADALLFDPAFMFAPASESGVDNIDLWVGGIAEQLAPFGGMLGSTFNYIFEIQLENLQNADRFYYLERLDGLNLLAQMEGNSFAELISRNTTLRGAAGNVFARPDLVINLDVVLSVPGVLTDDPSTPDYDESADPELVLLPNGTIRYVGGAHVIWNGTLGDDRVVSSEGDDTFTGSAGNDRFEGGTGNDTPNGGAGDDILTDAFGEDVIKGGPGNDAIHGGLGVFDLLQGNEGHDFIMGGNDVSEIFGGSGNDVMYTGDGATESFGGAGDDWLESGNQLNLLVGDENNQFQDDATQGHDVVTGGSGDDDFDMEGGDDIMVASVSGTDRLEGMLGFDWVTYRGDPSPVDADMLVTGLAEVIPNINELRDRFDLTEALSGYNQNDILRGDDRADLSTRVVGPTLVDADVLTAAGIARIRGLAALLPAGATRFDSGNIILGGAGSDIIEGRGGNDIIDGDAWLNVQLVGTLNDGTEKRANSLRELRDDVFANPQRLNPGNIAIDRFIVPGVAGTDVDTAVFSGPRDDYTITVNLDGTLTVAHDDLGIDGTDTVRNVEKLAFLDVTIDAPGAAAGTTAVPAVAGLSVAAAEAALNSAGLVLGVVTEAHSTTVPFGLVLDSNPLQGVGVAPGSAVNLRMSLGPFIEDVHDHTIEAAAAELALQGLTIGTITQVNHPEVPAGLIVTQDPAATVNGGIVAPGGVINVFLSTGPAAANTVPVVAGLPRADAEESIESVGLTVGVVTFANSATVPAGSVISSNPAAGTVLAPGAAVRMVVSLGTDGLVAAFGFNEPTGNVAVDSSVVARNGAIRAGTLRTEGKFGGSLLFNGSTSWVTVTDVTNSPLDLRTGMTIEAWVNPTELAGWETVVMKERGAGLQSWSLYANDGDEATPAGYVSIGTEEAVRRSPAVPLALNTWQHLAVTYDGAMHRLYVNGALVAEREQTGLMAVGNGALRIGGNNSFADEFFSGRIDEVRIYNRARTAAQITADMNTPLP